MHLFSIYINIQNITNIQKHIITLTPTVNHHLFVNQFSIFIRVLILPTEDE